MVLWWLGLCTKDYAETFYLISPNSRQMVKKARGLHKSVVLAIWSISKYKVTLPSQQFCFAPRTVSSENKLALGSVPLLFCYFCKCFRPPFLWRLAAWVWQMKRAKPRIIELWLPAINWFLVQASTLRALQKCTATNWEYLVFLWVFFLLLLFVFGFVVGFFCF